MKMAAVLLSLFLVVGCASEKVRPFGSLGLGYQAEGSTDHVLQRDREWQCKRWQQAWIEIGAEFRNGCSISLLHQSWYLCGSPFNERPEVDMNTFVGKCKIGGFK